MNWQLIDAGLAYAELYSSMPLHLVRHAAERVRELRKTPPVGTIWANETVNCNQSFVWDKKIASLSDTVMFPKLFRRLVAYGYYLETTKSKSKQELMTWLCDEDYSRDRNDRLLLPPKHNTNPPNVEFGYLHNLIKVHGQERRDRVELSLNYNPEDVIVLPDNV